MLSRVFPSKMQVVTLVLLTVLGLGFFSYYRMKESPKVLVFSKTAGFRHNSIPAGIVALRKLGQEHNFQVDTTENAAKFTEENLKQYSAVVFLNTTGDVLNSTQQADFERYIQAGGGYLGIHAATDTEYNWPWYNKLAGAYFSGHPNNPNVQKGTALVVDRKHISTKGFPKKWEKTDEFYNFKSFNEAVKVLVKMDEKTYKGGTNGDNHPMSWYHEFDGGRAFYTNFGHTPETFTEELFVKHLWGGLLFAMGGENPKALDYSKARSQRPPEENRFTKIVLDEKLDEPTELAILDDGRVLYAHRKGDLKLYDPAKKTAKLITQMPVYTKYEYGLMGLQLDPNFNQNHFIYLYYSPVDSTDSAQRLSRFVFDPQQETLQMNSEKIILKVPVKRNDCCHTGGSIAFDKQGNLYLSAGDDTNPFNSNGFAPIDDRPGRKGWDALATSGNTNDLRGKIMRIKVNADGTYSIPEGNLFPKGNPKARPEIYVMGNRNPYRISIDQHTGFLYWGEVGPDAKDNNEKRGPRGHDEVNQARKAGFFGWPLFVGDNKPYNDFNFADSASGPTFDPAKPVNNSANNTGLTELPPAQKAFIWYPYAESKEFPMVGTGGRNAMAGPVYYADDYANSSIKFPGYYNGKFFAYEWMRGWIMAVTINEQGDFVSMEQFMPNTTFNHPIDMQFAKDGSLYVLEYGSNWFAQNDDARLVRIEYTAGNRRPVAKLTTDKAFGAAPLTVKFSSNGSIDYDKDALKYEWKFTDNSVQSTDANPTFTFAKPGVYNTTLTVTDAAGNSNTAKVEIKVGNEIPKVEVVMNGNRSFYWPNQKVNYEVKVSDKEDGSLANGGIKPEEVTVRVDYLEGFDRAVLNLGHQMNTGFAAGQRLIELSDCKACHSIDKKSIGPAYMDVAKKYRKERNSIAVDMLAKKVINGGGGVWGEQAMSAHPQLAMNDAKEMVRYILSLGNEKKVPSRPTQGIYTTEEKGNQGTYLFAASYTDRGTPEIGPLAGQELIALRHPKVQATSADVLHETDKYRISKEAEMIVGKLNNSYIGFKQIDLTGINSVTVSALSRSEQDAGGKLEVRLGSPTGKVIGSAEVKDNNTSPVTVTLENTGTIQDLYFVFTNSNAQGRPLFGINYIQFNKASM